MPRPRFERLGPEKKESILNAALEAFSTQGLDGASYNQIIERAGISKGAMYYYFDDKEDLFATVVSREIAGIWEALHEFPEVSSIADYWSMLHEFLHRFMEFAAGRPLSMGLFRQVLRLKKDGNRSPAVQQIQELGLQWTRQFLEVGKAVGAVRRDLPDELLLALINAVDEAGDLYFIEHLEEFSVDEFHRWGATFMDLVRRMVAPEVRFLDVSP